MTSAGWPEGGVETGLQEIKKLLVEEGHEVMLVASDRRWSPDHFSDRTFRQPTTGGWRRLIQHAWNHSAFTTVRASVREFAPDVVSFHVLGEPTAAALVAARGVPRVVCVHGPEIYVKRLLPWCLPRTDFRGDSYALSSLSALGWVHYVYLRAVCKPLLELALRGVSAFVAFSTYTQGVLQEEGRSPVGRVNNGIRLNGFRPLTPESTTIAYAGRLEKVKGVHYLIRALAHVRRSFPEVHLEIAGTGSYQEDLVRMVEDLGLGEHVRFLGQLDLDGVADLYARSRVVAMPSVWPETFGKAGVEALSVGRPVVASGVGGVFDWLEHEVNGLIVEPGDVEDLSEALLRVLADASLAERLGIAAHRSAQRFSIDEEARGLVGVFADVVRPPAPHAARHD
ncbi:glycosyltransferase family 4 protein [Kineococcus radiotolerans]|uniref:glycosyltransferase family 4 protein n=1 Tax=Kineococcus radiotolerans TaxID=131568 RepID=UPI00138ABC4A|nr:glycosyltransferase family 4 protein [Kineococcus radiotolerans]